MRRRALLTSLTALGTALGGCFAASPGGGPAADPPDGTEGVPPGGEETATVVPGDTEPTTGDRTTTRTRPDAAVVVALRVGNETDAAADVSVTLTRSAIPACQYDEPACREPIRQTTPLDETFALAAGETERAVVGLPRTPAIDAYEVYARVGDRTASLEGLEVGVESGPDPDAFDWRVADGRYDVRATVTAPGGIELAARRA